jgi:thiol-disulfide isomerase/thioredoxin
LTNHTSHARRTGRAAIAFATACAATIALLVAGCGSSDPESAATSAADFKKALAGAPAPLKRLYSQPGELLGGETAAFKARLADLEGHPVVVNKWASWCGPCRFEFPFFQKQAKKRGAEIAFVAINAEDSKDAARKFLKNFPVPYPSYFDPDSKVAEVIGGERSFPVTAFYDRKGDLVYTKQGGYASEAVLADDIRQYAR